MEFEWDPQKRSITSDSMALALRKLSKTDVETSLDDELRPEYDKTLLKNGVRGQYVQRFPAGAMLVLLAPDGAAAFPTAKAVNEALWLLIKISQQSLAPADVGEPLGPAHEAARATP